MGCIEKHRLAKGLVGHARLGAARPQILWVMSAVASSSCILVKTCRSRRLYWVLDFSSEDHRAQLIPPGGGLSGHSCEGRAHDWLLEPASMPSHRHKDIVGGTALQSVITPNSFE